MSLRRASSSVERKRKKKRKGKTTVLTSEHKLKQMAACCSSYFSIDQILADEEEVPVYFNTPSFLLGKELVIRNQHGERQAEVLAESRTNMALWLAIPLYLRRFVSIQHIPHAYTVASFREFRVDPLARNLRAKNAYYFELGARIAALIGEQNEGVRLRKQMGRLFQLRFFHVVKAGYGGKRGLDLQDVRDALTEIERGMLEAIVTQSIDEKTFRKV